MVGLLAIAIAATVVFFAFKGLAPDLRQWDKQLFVQELARRARATNDVAVRRTIVSQLGELTPASLVLLAEFAADPQASFADVAQTEIDRLQTHWEIVAEETIDHREIFREMAVLAEALATRIDEFGPAGRRWLAQLAVRMVEQSERAPPQLAVRLLAACDRAISEAPTAPRSTPITPMRPQQAMAVPLPSPTIDLNAVEPRGKVARPPSENPLRAKKDMQDDPPTEVPDRELGPITIEPDRSASVDQPRTTVRVNEYPEPKPLPKPLPKPQPTPSEPPTAASPAELVEIPSPTQMRAIRRNLRRMSIAELRDELLADNRYLQAAARAEWSHRLRHGAAPVESLSGGATSDVPTTPAIEALQELPSAEVRGQLRELLRDADPQIRLEALTALATADDPRLEEFARELAVGDEDSRVARLANKILQSLRR